MTRNLSSEFTFASTLLETFTSIFTSTANTLAQNNLFNLLNLLQSQIQQTITNSTLNFVNLA